MAPQPAPEFVPVEGIIEAPVIFFEICPTIGNHNGVVSIQLATGMVEPTGGDGIRSRVKAVAHLRMTIAGAIGLRETIDKALLLGTPAATSRSN